MEEIGGRKGTLKQGEKVEWKEAKVREDWDRERHKWKGI